MGLQELEKRFRERMDARIAEENQRMDQSRMYGGGAGPLTPPGHLDAPRSEALAASKGAWAYGKTPS